jgi:hypothetical protein
MKRRAFITLFGGAVASWPLAARAQQPACLWLECCGPIGRMCWFAEPFRRYMKAIGWEEGRSVS